VVRREPREEELKKKMQRKMVAKKDRVVRKNKNKCLRRRTQEMVEMEMAEMEMAEIMEVMAEMAEMEVMAEMEEMITR